MRASASPAGEELLWEAPSPGVWTFDPTHIDHPTTGLQQGIRSRPTAGASAGFAVGMARTGIAVAGVEFAIINGWRYLCRRSVGEVDLADRELAAEDMLANRRWREVGERWFAIERPAIAARCTALQDRSLERLDNGALGNHLLETVDLFDDAVFAHFAHASLQFVIGELWLACASWGIEERQALDLMVGASPASSAAAHRIGAIAEALRAANCRPQSLDSIRAASDEARAALDAYLAEFGSRLSTGFDFDDLTLAEMPDVVLTSVLAALERPLEMPSADDHIAMVRERIPFAERDRFDDLLTEARFIHALRDDDEGLAMWARGLIRLAVLEAARRLARASIIADKADAFDASPDELVALLNGGGPSRDELSRRATLRSHHAQLVPPPVVRSGVVEPPPELPPELPPAVARVTKAYRAYSMATTVSEGDGLRGFGIGEAPYTGRARVAHRAEDAFAKLEPGDVLITAMTTPAFNGILPIAGALVVRDAGLMSHAAIMARELGIPAVLGVVDALEDIPDGALIEVDPVEGAVRVLEERP